MAETGNNIRRTSIIAASCSERFVPLSAPGCRAMWDWGIRFSGRSILRDEYVIRRPEYGLHLLLYTLGGRGWLKTPGVETESLRPGTVWICPRRTPMEYGLAGSRWEIAWVSLADGGEWSKIRSIGNSVHRSALGPRIAESISRIDTEHREGGETSAKAISLHGRLLMLYVERELATGPPRTERAASEIWSSLTERVREALEHPWTVAGLADLSGLAVTPDHFCRLCVQHLGVTPMRWLTRLRMDRAADLLEHTDYPSYTIAPLVGYTNEFSFSTAFKRRFSCSPRAFRKRHRPAERSPGTM